MKRHAFGPVIKLARIRKNLTQQNVADAIGHTAAYVSELEAGKRGHRISPLLSSKLADYLNIPLSFMRPELDNENDRFFELLSERKLVHDIEVALCNAKGAAIEVGELEKGGKLMISLMESLVAIERVLELATVNRLLEGEKDGDRGNKNR